jgi:hypothetical protein
MGARANGGIGPWIKLRNISCGNTGENYRLQERVERKNRDGFRCGWPTGDESPSKAKNEKSPTQRDMHPSAGLENSEMRKKKTTTAKKPLQRRRYPGKPNSTLYRAEGLLVGANDIRRSRTIGLRRI